MKIFFRYFLFLALCSCCYTASAGTDDNVGYVVGNNYGVGPGDQKWRETGPNGDVTVTFRYGSGTNNLVFYKPTQLGPTGVSLKWEQLDSASGGGFLYCNRSGTSSGTPMSIKHKMVDSGKSYGGHKLLKTSVPGLYYTLAISNIWSAYTFTDINPSGIYIGDATEHFFTGMPRVSKYYIGLATMRIIKINIGPLVALCKRSRLNFIPIPTLTRQRING